MKNETGITLVILIITIIVLIILAGISISAIVGDDGIINETINSKASAEYIKEKEEIQTLILKNLYVGTCLYDKNLENGTKWNIIVIDSDVYGTGWYYIEEGTEIVNYGETKYNWLINYETQKVIELEDNDYDNYNIASLEGLIFNMDIDILNEMTNEDLQNDSSILGESVTLNNFDYDESSGITEDTFNFDGEDDYILIDFSENLDELYELYENGFTFEYYGTMEMGSHLDNNGNDISSENDTYSGVFGIWNGLAGDTKDDSEQARVRFLFNDTYLNFSVLTNDDTFISPNSQSKSPWNVRLKTSLTGSDSEHYWAWTLNCSEIVDENGNIKYYVDGDTVLDLNGDIICYISNDGSVLDLSGEEICSISDGNYSDDTGNVYFKDTDDSYLYYSLKLFVDGEFVYTTGYSISQFYYLTSKKEDWDLKYFTLGRCSYSSKYYWHYSKMNVKCMRLYNRGLTEDEIKDNYEMTKVTIND